LFVLSAVEKLVESVKEIQQEYKDRDKKLELNELTSQLCSGEIITVTNICFKSQAL
jgi:hypothetical protein